jgi:hypothetical protein
MALFALGATGPPLDRHRGNEIVSRPEAREAASNGSAVR